MTLSTFYCNYIVLTNTQSPVVDQSDRTAINLGIVYSNHARGNGRGRADT